MKTLLNFISYNLDVTCPSPLPSDWHLVLPDNNNPSTFVRSVPSPTLTWIEAREECHNNGRMDLARMETTEEIRFILGMRKGKRPML